MTDCDLEYMKLMKEFRDFIKAVEELTGDSGLKFFLTIAVDWNGSCEFIEVVGSKGTEEISYCFSADELSGDIQMLADKTFKELIERGMEFK